MSQPNNYIEALDFKDFVVLLHKGDERAWSQLNFVLKRMLMKWLSRKNIDIEHANEIFSNTVAVFTEKLTSVEFDDFRGMKSYVFSIADLKVKEYYREKQKSQRQESIETITNPDYLSLMSDGESFEKKDAARKIYQLFQRLTHIEQLVMTSIYREDLDHKETAQLLGISEGNLRIIKYRALGKLKKWYAKINKE